ncbi:MAG: hypothetical protein FWG63_11580 [Defluviitaleaceae bacterium]|nr:hypothetical protein [Defluviitaleaceae bacterium]
MLRVFFFNYVENTHDCSKKENLLYSKREDFALAYRELYRLLHDYLNDCLNLLETVYTLNGSYIWELHEMHDNFDKREIDTNKPVAYTKGVKHNVELNSFGLPKSSSIPIHNDYISIIQDRIVDAVKKEKQYLEQISTSVQVLRNDLVKYIAVTEIFELAVLEGEIKPNNSADIEKQISQFLQKKPKNIKDVQDY